MNYSSCVDHSLSILSMWILVGKVINHHVFVFLVSQSCSSFIFTYQTLSTMNIEHIQKQRINYAWNSIQSPESQTSWSLPYSKQNLIYSILRRSCSLLQVPCGHLQCSNECKICRAESCCLGLQNGSKHMVHGAVHLWRHCCGLMELPDGATLLLNLLWASTVIKLDCMGHNVISGSTRWINNCPIHGLWITAKIKKLVVEEKGKKKS